MLPSANGISFGQRGIPSAAFYFASLPTDRLTNHLEIIFPVVLGKGLEPLSLSAQDP